MKRLSTPCMNEIENRTDKSRNEKKSAPSRKTLDFLSQFARVYHSEPVMQPELCGLVLN